METVMIMNAEIKFRHGIAKGGMSLDTQHLVFQGCNIDGGFIKSFHAPRFSNCYLQEVTKGEESPSEKEGTLFNACRVQGVEVPSNSNYSDCAGQIPKK